MERPLPSPTEETRPYWDAARAGKLLIQKCSSCGRLQFYPRLYCVSCFSDRMEWVTSSGRGTIYTYTINYRPANDFMKDRTPYAVAMVDLAEGVRMLANLVESDLQQIRVGAEVEVVFEKVSPDITLPQFRLVV